MSEQTFGKILQIERKKQGISQAKLSEMTGFTSRVIGYWENNQHDISLKNVEIVTKALGIAITISAEGIEVTKC